MSFFYYRNASLAGTPKIHTKDSGITAMAQTTRFGGGFAVGDRMVFTSALFHGAFGPPKQTTDAYYSDHYSADIMAQFGTQPYNGYQNFVVPTGGTYRFTLQGGYAGHNNLQAINSYSFNDSVVTISPTDPAVGHSNDLSYGLPGHLVADVTLAAGDELNILVGQCGNSQIYNTTTDVFRVGGTGGGASCVWVGSVGNSNYAIAGGAGGERDQGEYTSVRTGNSSYSAFGGSGYSGGNTYSGGSNGTGGSGDTRGCGGAGLVGNGNAWGDTRSDGTKPYFSVRTTATRLDQGGQGGFAGTGYINPFYNCAEGSLGFTINSSTYKVTTARGWAGGTSAATKGFVSLSTYEDYIDGTTSSIVGQIPVAAFSGGFGGGGLGNWGGCGGGGGDSGGGGGSNGDVAGGGSSQVDTNKWTQVSHTNYSKVNTSSAAPAATDFHNFNIPSSLAASGTFVISSGILPTGCWKGNGFVTMERTA